MNAISVEEIEEEALDLTQEWGAIYAQAVHDNVDVTTKRRAAQFEGMVKLLGRIGMGEYIDGVLMEVWREVQADCEPHVRCVTAEE